MGNLKFVKMYVGSAKKQGEIQPCFDRTHQKDHRHRLVIF